MFRYWRISSNFAVIAALTLLLVACSQGAVPSSTAAVQATETTPIATEITLSTSTIPTTEAVSPTDPPPLPLPPTQPASTTQPPTESVTETAAIPTTSAASETEPAAPQDGIVVDQTSVDLFEQIPEEYLHKAAEMRVVFYDASVGKNISDGLDCLASPSWVQSPVFCRRDYTGQGQEWKVFTEADYNANRVPERILFPGGPTYDRSRWVFSPLGGGWNDFTGSFVTQMVPENLDQYDVFSHKINYQMVDGHSNIMDPEFGYFSDRPDQSDIHDFQALVDANPDKKFFLWTTSLARSIGTEDSEAFNQQMRQFAVENGIPLFDLASILSHNDAGEPCYDNRDGVKSCSNNGECEEFPEDGVNLAAICQDYTTEAEGGHLGSVSGGMIRASKAFWVMMARLAGWQPGL